MMERFEMFFIGDKSKKKRLVFGVGINDANYLTEYKKEGRRFFCIYYMKWRSMLQRCYDKRYQERFPTYKGCSVCKEWLRFSNFRKWMSSQKHQNRELDKDIKIKGNKIYSPDTCIFVPKSINRLFNDHQAGRGRYPQGVNFHKNKNKFRSECSVNGKNKHLGYFETEKEAYIEYLKSDWCLMWLLIIKKQSTTFMRHCCVDP